jgi:hypothetical protein
MLLTARALHSGDLVQDTNFLSGVYDFIQQSEYEIRWIPDQSVHMAANRAQNLRFAFGADGFALSSRATLAKAIQSPGKWCSDCRASVRPARQTVR